MRVEIHLVLDKKKNPHFSRKAMRNWPLGQWPEEHSTDNWQDYWKKKATTLAKNGWKVKGVWILKH